MDAERKQKRESEVTMYRRYRIGDLPDIQIPYSAIIAPLQGLAHVRMTYAVIRCWSMFYLLTDGCCFNFIYRHRVMRQSEHFDSLV